MHNVHYYSLDSLLLAIEIKTTPNEKLTQTPSGAGEEGAQGDVFVCACWWRLLSGSEIGSEFSFSFSLLPLLVYQQTSDRNYRFCSGWVSDLSKALENKKNFPISFAQFPALLLCYLKADVCEIGKYQDETFGFCVNWLRNSDRLNRLTNEYDAPLSQNCL